MPRSPTIPVLELVVVHQGTFDSAERDCDRVHSNPQLCNNIGHRPIHVRIWWSIMRALAGGVQTDRGSHGRSFFVATCVAQYELRSKQGCEQTRYALTPPGGIAPLVGLGREADQRCEISGLPRGGRIGSGSIKAYLHYGRDNRGRGRQTVWDGCTRDEMPHRIRGFTVERQSASQRRVRLWICGQPPPGSLAAVVRPTGVAHNSTGATSAEEARFLSLQRQ